MQSTLAIRRLLYQTLKSGGLEASDALLVTSTLARDQRGTAAASVLLEHLLRLSVGVPRDQPRWKRYSLSRPRSFKKRVVAAFRTSKSTTLSVK